MDQTGTPHLLLVTATTGYQARAFVEAAGGLRAHLTIASDRCHQLDDPWGDQALAIRFERPDESLPAVLQRHREQAIDGMVACGDRAALLAAHIAAELGLPGNPVAAVEACHDKFAFRQRQAAAGLPAPWFQRFPLDANPDRLAASIPYPCVVKPLLLSGSRGVIRADEPAAFRAAFERLRRLLLSPEIRQLHDANADWIQIESYLPGRELALEGLLEDGELLALALFDKPDPLEGPFFEETLYVTPSRLPAEAQQSVVEAVQAATRALGLRRGPIHAEVRCHAGAVVVLEVAARPIGGLCARTLRFCRNGSDAWISLEELLVRAALGARIRQDGWRRDDAAAGVLMIPVPGGGVLEQVEGVDQAAAVTHIEAVEITARPRQALVPLPEGCTYPGFLFARASRPGQVEDALRQAHAHLRFTITPQLPLLV